MFLPECKRPIFTPTQNNKQNYSSVYIDLRRQTGRQKLALLIFWLISQCTKTHIPCHSTHTASDCKDQPYNEVHCNSRCLSQKLHNMWQQNCGLSKIQSFGVRTSRNIHLALRFKGRQAENICFLVS